MAAIAPIMTWLRALFRVQGIKKSAPNEAGSTQAILQHCRESLAIVRQELSTLPWTRVQHEIFAGIDAAEHTIDRMEARLAGVGQVMKVG